MNPASPHLDALVASDGGRTSPGLPAHPGSPVHPSGAVSLDSGQPLGFSKVLKRALHPPLGDRRFWLVQAMVLVLTAIHLSVDLSGLVEGQPAISALLVATLMIPMVYAALHYGLHGSAATAVWATVLWLPDMALRPASRELSVELVVLLLSDSVALFVGHRIEREMLISAQVRAAEREQRATEARYRQLFVAIRAPILLVDTAGRIVEANPAAWAVLGGGLIGRPAGTLLGIAPGALEEGGSSGRITLRPGGEPPREFRYITSRVGGYSGEPFVQILLQDVTAELRQWKDASAFARALLRAQEEERERLSRELHDDPVQVLAHLAGRLELLAEQPGAESLQAPIGEARYEAIGVLRSLRQIAQGLRPHALEHLGLVATLRSLASEAEGASGCQVELRVTGREHRVGDEIELGLFRVVQEALANATRHGKAGHVRLEVIFEEMLMELRVQDDGTGFDVSAAWGPEHLGLRGMRERASLLGGRLSLESHEGEGTLLVVKVPLGGGPP